MADPTDLAKEQKRLEYIIELAKDLITAKQEPMGRDITLEQMRDYAKGEFWGDGQYWRGRKPKEDDFTVIEKDLTEDDNISSSFQTIVSGMLGRDPEWELTDPTKKDENGNILKPEIPDLETAMTLWHKDSHFHTVLQKATYNMQWSPSYLRIYIPDTFEDKANEGEFSDLNKAQQIIVIQELDATQAGAIRDTHNLIVGYYYQYTVTENDRDITRIEIHTPEKIYYFKMHETVSTGIKRVLDEGDSNLAGLWLDDWELEDVRDNPLYDSEALRKPYFLIYEMDRLWGPSLTRSVMDSQDALNVDSTYMRRNGEVAGFPVFVTDNANMEDEEGNETQLSLAPGKHINVIGQPIYDEEKNITGYTAPASKRLDPVNPTQNIIPAISHWRANILRHLDCLWKEQTLLAQSGIAYVEARKPFEKRIVLESPVVVEAMRWALKRVAMLAHYLTQGKSIEEVKFLDFTPRLFLDVSPTELATYQALIAGYEANVVSLDSVIENMPVSVDPKAEKEKVLQRQAEAEARRQEDLKMQMDSLGGNNDPTT
jgi:hypothetical protein